MMTGYLVPYRKRGRGKPQVAVKPIYGASGRKIVDYELIGYDHATDSLINPLLLNLGMGSAIRTGSQSFYSSLDKGRKNIFYAQCKHIVYSTKDIVWVTVSMLYVKSSLNSGVLGRLDMYVNNPSSYK
jgi:hypothetical protein